LEATSINKAKSFADFPIGPIQSGITILILPKACEKHAWNLLDILFEYGFKPNMPQ
jgi:hypothetical protein